MASRSSRSWTVHAFTFAVAGLLALGAAACSPEPDPGSIRVKWRLGFGVDCNAPEAGIDTVRVTVLEVGEGALEVSSESFACSAGEGTIARLPIGTYNLLLEGGVKTGFKIPVFKATVGGIVVPEGAVVEVGEVALEKLPPSENPGGLEIEWTFESGLCGANKVATVQLTVWRESVFKQHQQSYACDLPEGRVTLDVQPGTYAVVAEGFDLLGQIVRRGSRDDVDVTQGETTALVGSNAIVLEPL